MGNKIGRFRVLLVYPNLQMVNLLPSNIAILSAYLKEHGIEVRLFDTTFYHTADKSVDEIRVEHMQLRPFNLQEKGVGYRKTNIFEDFNRAVDEYNPDIIGISATDDTYDLGIDLVSGIKGPKRHVIVGGVRPTFSAEEVINNKYIDSVCIGEGEEALLELCNKMRHAEEITGIQNLWVKKDGKIYKNSLRKPIDIDKVPYEDFDIFEEERFFRPMQGRVFRMMPVSIDRGCPYGCTFCAAPALRRLYQDEDGNGYFRIKSLSRIIAELKSQIQKYKADYIYFNSETFFARSEAGLEEFARDYAAEVGLPFWCQTRVETITEKRIKILEEMNCDRISVGLEHGNEEFRKKILKKDFSNKQVIDAFRIIEKSRIPVTVNNIVGFPDETRELAFDTIKLNRCIKADSINAYFFVPYRGTPLRDYCIKKGYLDAGVRTDTPMKSSILKMPQFTPEEIKGLVRVFPLYVKMPDSYFEKIRAAEEITPEGDKALTGLREIYFREYFN